MTGKEVINSEPKLSFRKRFRNFWKNFDASVPTDPVVVMLQQIDNDAIQIRQRRLSGTDNFSDEHIDLLLDQVNDSGRFGNDRLGYKNGNLTIDSSGGKRYIPVGNVKCIGNFIAREMASKDSGK